MADPIDTLVTPLPGPVDRVSFLAEQARNRRASWLLALAALTAIVLTGIALGIVAAPLFYFAILLVGLVMTATHPHSAWMMLVILPAAIFPMLFGLAFAPGQFTYNAGHGAQHPHGLWPVVIGVTIFAVVPGAVMFVALWRIVTTVLRRGGARAILARLGARPCDPHDDEARRLADVVEEIAVAAGISVPRIAIIDAKDAIGAANAAAVGWSVDDATIVVTRPLLDQLTREQTQTVIARVVASIGNADLRIAFRMLTIFHTVRVIQFALIGASRWRTMRVIWRSLGLALTTRSVSSDDEELAVATDLLACTEYRTTLDAALQPHASLVGCLFAPLLFPARFSAWTIAFIISASEYLVTGPLVDATWRRRELLADATAVKLTRNPKGLVDALERLRRVPVMLPHADAISYLFAVWWADQPRGTALFTRQMHASPERRLAQLAEMGAGVTAAPPPANTPLGDVLAGIVALMFAQLVWFMMTIALALTSAELFALGLFGLWLAKRFG
jgi:Zn-dependent protease with chaperone function